MTLQDYVDVLIAQRSSGGLFLTPEEVLACAVQATREYAGYADLEDPAYTGDGIDVVAGTLVTLPEWAVIGPFFGLFVERENALRLESSVGLGAPMIGRSSGEVAGDIAQYRQALPQMAFSYAASSVGFPAGY